MSEFVAGWVFDPDAAHAGHGGLRPALSISVLLAAFGLMALPAVIAVLVLIGGIS